MTTQQATLSGQKRDKVGKGVARQLRAKGLVPAVVYGPHLEQPVTLAVNPKELKKAIATPHRFNTLISLVIEGGSTQLVLLKDYQQDPVTRDVLHADFIDVRETEEIKVNVPLVLVGKSVGVADGGILSQARRELEVFALPRSIPEAIQVDITNLKINDVLHAKDLQLPAGVRFESRVNYTIAVVAVPEGGEAPAAAAAAATAAPAKAAPAKAAGKK